jgi:serine/threonine-protein kinase RsbW
MTAPSHDVPSLALQLTSQPSCARFARLQIADFARAHGAASDLVDRVALAVAEAVANVVRHAYPSGIGPLDCHADVDEGLLEIVVADRGSGFRPQASAGLGAGLAIIADCCDDFTIAQRRDAGVEVWMRFALVAPA